ncbi:MAG: alpha/beta hydrolase [Vicinamibacterales bacterium]
MLPTVTLLGAAALTERWFEIRDMKRLAGSETFVSLGDASVRYKFIGREQPSVPVVLLTGLAGSIEQWEVVQARLAQFAPVLAYDRAGSGFSQGSRAHDAAQQADELASLLTELRIDRRIVLVGYSMSASLARVFVSRYREKVSGIVLVAPYMPELEGRTLDRQRPPRAYARWLLHETTTTLFGLKRFASAFTKGVGSSGYSASVENRATGVLLRFGHWWAVDREVLADAATASQVLSAGGLESLPLILVSDNTSSLGDHGRVMDDVDGTFVARSSRGTLRHLPPADHGMLLNDPAQYKFLIAAIQDVASMAR